MELGVTTEQSYGELIKAGCNNNYTSLYPDFSTSLKDIYHLLQRDFKVTMYHKGALYKGYIHFSLELGFQFSVRGNALSQKIDFNAQLPDFKNIGQHSLAMIYCYLEITP